MAPACYALIVLQIALALMNARGVYKNDPELKVTTEKSPPVSAALQNVVCRT